MRLRGHKALDLEAPLYVKRGTAAQPFVVASRSFVAGDAFPWKDLGLADRQLTRLWDQRRIGHEQLAERNGAEDPPRAAPKSKPKKK